MVPRLRLPLALGSHLGLCALPVPPVVSPVADGLDLPVMEVNENRWLLVALRGVLRSPTRPPKEGGGAHAQAPELQCCGPPHGGATMM